MGVWKRAKRVVKKLLGRPIDDRQMTICTDCPAGGARMTIQPYENGLLVPVGDVQAMASAMEELIDDPALCERLSREAVRIKDRLTIDIIGEKWLQMI